jgi:hypothetical protein
MAMKRSLLLPGVLVVATGLWAATAGGQIYPPKQLTSPAGPCWGYLDDVPKIDNTVGAYQSRGLKDPEVIKKWDASNVDEIKDNLMPSMYKRVKERGLVLLETAYIPYTPNKAWVEATKQYAPSVKLGPDGYTVGYQAGVPFPVSKRIYGDVAHFDVNDPQQALKLINNQDDRWQGDEFMMYNDIYITDSSGGQRRLSNTYSRYRLEGRVIMNPKPVVPDSENPDGLRFIEIAQVTYPYELAGLFSLQHSFKDRHKEDNFWLYIRSLRRVRRASAAQRLDTFAGTDLAYEDFMGFNGFLGDFTYKIVGVKDTYLVRHQPYWPPQDVAHLQANPIYVEKVPNVIWYEQYPKNKNHIYSKRLFFYDPDMDTNIHWEAYDRKGDLWKSFVWMYRLDGYNNDGFPYLIFPETIDYLTNHATLWPVRHEGQICDLNADYYALERMQARGH